MSDAVRLWYQHGSSASRRNDELSEIKEKAKRHLSATGWKFWYGAKGCRKELRYTSPTGTVYYSLRMACKGYIEEGETRKRKSKTPPPLITEEGWEDESPKKPRKGPKKIKKPKKGRIKRTNVRVREKPIAGASASGPRTILSWLIDNGAISPLAEVHYDGGRTPKKGRVTREGIRCDCCSRVFTLSAFEAHSGSTKHRPGANIYFEDGRSISVCQSEVKRANPSKKPVKSIAPVVSPVEDRNDRVCSVCNYGGEVLCCDQCPAVFHVDCLGLRSVPDGDWFCSSCCCGFCGQRISDSKAESSSCEQCERKFHVYCLEKMEETEAEHRWGKWFCSRDCKTVFSGLQKLVGKPVAVGSGLTWTLSKGGDSADVENHSKLSIALNVMQECFESIKDPFTGRELVEDVIFSRESELKRLNFKGFYTILLEKDDDLITVANVRVYGRKVAEMPLVATRFNHRGGGMCRLLVNELERQLRALGVERLVLPAVPGMLNTWTSKFGFSAMGDPERFNFLDFTFLDFQDTTMCQKQLSKPVKRML